MTRGHTAGVVVVHKPKAHHLIAEQLVRALHHRLEHLRQRRPAGDGCLDFGEPFQRNLTLLEHRHEPQILLRTNLAFGAQRALLVEHAERAQRHREAPPHRTQEPDLLRLESIEPRASHDQVTLDLLDRDADGTQLSDTG